MRALVEQVGTALPLLLFVAVAGLFMLGATRVIDALSNWLKYDFPRWRKEFLVFLIVVAAIAVYSNLSAEGTKSLSERIASATGAVLAIVLWGMVWEWLWDRDWLKQTFARWLLIAAPLIVLALLITIVWFLPHN